MERKRRGERAKRSGCVILPIRAVRSILWSPTTTTTKSARPPGALKIVQLWRVPILSVGQPAAVVVVVATWEKATIGKSAEGGVLDWTGFANASCCCCRPAAPSCVSSCLSSSLLAFNAFMHALPEAEKNAAAALSASRAIDLCSARQCCPPVVVRHLCWSPLLSSQRVYRKTHTHARIHAHRLDRVISRARTQGKESERFQAPSSAQQGSSVFFLSLPLRHCVLSARCENGKPTSPRFRDQKPAPRTDRNWG